MSDNDDDSDYGSCNIDTPTIEYSDFDIAQYRTLFQNLLHNINNIARLYDQYRYSYDDDFEFADNPDQIADQITTSEYIIPNLNMSCVFAFYNEIFGNNKYFTIDVQTPDYINCKKDAYEVEIGMFIKNKDMSNYESLLDGCAFDNYEFTINLLDPDDFDQNFKPKLCSILDKLLHGFVNRY